MIKLLAMVVLASCGGRSPDPTRPDRPVERGSGSETVADAPTEQECDKLLVHTVTMAVAERPDDQRIDGEAQAKLRAELRPQFMTECRAMTRASYGCAIAAAKTEQIAACDAK